MLEEGNSTPRRSDSEDMSHQMESFVGLYGVNMGGYARGLSELHCHESLIWCSPCWGSSGVAVGLEVQGV